MQLDDISLVRSGRAQVGTTAKSRLGRAKRALNGVGGLLWCVLAVVALASVCALCACAKSAPSQSRAESQEQKEEREITSEELDEAFATVRCQFHNISDEMMVVFATTEGEICAIIGINEKGYSENLTAHLNPGSYYAIGEAVVEGEEDPYVEFEVASVDEEYTLDIDGETGALDLKRTK